MKTDFRSLWTNCLIIIKDNISEAAYNTWFAPIVPISYRDNIFTVQVPSQFFYEYLEEKYIDLIQRTLHRVMGEETILNYRVVVASDSDTAIEIRGESKKQSFPKPSVPQTNKVPSPFNRVEPQEFDSQINTKYSFDNFFEGNSNKLGRTAAEAVAENPAKTAFNPLFIHGSSGVGKTHLCHAIGAKIMEKFPEKKVLYLSAHLFKVQYTDATRFNTVNDFINFYQGVDILIIDDIQELSGLIKTMAGVEERLLTRFRWGLTTQLERPEKDLRKIILQQKIIADGLEISESVIDYIAENVTDNVRDLEGIIVSLMAHSIINDTEIDLTLARRVIEQSIKFEIKKITVQKIQEVVCDYFNIKRDLIQSRSRKREIVQARQVAMYFTKTLTEMSLAQIGSHIGKRNHATVLHACNNIRGLMEVDKTFRSNIDEIERILHT